MTFIDSHVHLTDEDYPDPAAIVADFDRDRIEFVITVGYDLPSSRACAALSRRFDRVYAAVGVHPHDADTCALVLYDELRDLARSERVAALGEIGLDYHYDRSAREVQRRAFVEQLELADALGLPVILHIREATGDCVDLLRQNRRYLRRGGELHCYSCGAELVPFFADLGLYFGFGGSTTFKNASKLLDAVRAVPADRLLTETDCPYLTPVPFRGQTNFPKYVALAAEKIAEVRGENLEALCAQVRVNTLRLFPRIAADLAK